MKGPQKYWLIGGAALFAGLMVWLLTFERQTRARRPDPDPQPLAKASDLPTPGPSSRAERSKKVNAALKDHKGSRAEGLTALILDPSQSLGLRTDAIRELAELPDRKASLRQLLVLLGKLPRGPNTELREELVLSLGHHIHSEKGRARLLDFLKPTHPSGERRHAISALAKNSSAWVVPYLKPIAENDPDLSVRKHARQTLNTLQ